MARHTTTHIKNLFLDPNNYRFLDNEDYQHIKDNNRFDSEIQNRTLGFLEKDGFKDLEDSFKKNGYLPVDIIQVEEVEKNRYLIIEGNRRVATLKKLWKSYEKERSKNLGDLDPSIFKSVPITDYQEVSDENHHLIIMGLKHISGNKKWKAYNQALLVRNLQTQHKMPESEIIKSLAISKQDLFRILKTLALIDGYKKSEFGDQFKSSMYSTFQILANNVKVKSFIGLDDNLKIKNSKNRDRLFSLLSEVENIDAETGEKHKLERIISTAVDARNLTKVIDDKKVIEEMEETRSFAKGYAISDKVHRDRANTFLKNIEIKFNEVLPLSEFLDRKAEDKIEDILNKIYEIKQKKRYNLFNDLNKDVEVFMNFKSKALSEIEIIKYKKLENLKINKLNRINIFAGVNNSGKSSLLEAINLLINQNDTYNFLDMQRIRGKFPKLNALWLNSEFRDKIEIKGRFNYVPISLNIQKEEEETDNLDKNNYLSTFEFESTFGDENLKSSVRLFQDKNEKFYKTIRVVCNNSYSNPYLIQNRTYLEKSYAKAVSKDILKDILTFIKDNIDNDITDIRFTKECIETFQVNHKDFTVDLSGFGDGLQAIFYIALQFASAENGVILIDEFENGIHYSLLEKFTEFIQKLAIKLNVQVFLTTHSKETIEAFVNNGFENEDINFYRISKNRKTGNINTIKYNSKLLLEEFSDNQEVRGW